MSLLPAFVSGQPLEDLWKNRLRGAEFKELSSEVLARAQNLFRRTLQSPGDLAELRAAWRELDMCLVSTNGPDGPWLALYEAPSTEAGRGFYAIRCGTNASDLLLEAPHSDSDIQTGLIAWRLFQESRARAAAFNTLSRKKADVAHLANTFFQAFTLAFAETWTNSLVLQFHGFEASKRAPRTNEVVNLIVSGGQREPARWIRTFAAQLKTRLDPAVKLYPDDIKELGATRNAQAIALQERQHTGFLHLEMSADFRRQFSVQPKQRAAFLQCLPPRPEPGP